MSAPSPSSTPDSQTRISTESSQPTDTPAAVHIKDLRVDYGTLVAVDNLNLTVRPGQIYGLVGANGAGKTSTFRVLTTLLQPTYGSVKLSGIDVLSQPERAHGIVGYMPDLAPVPSDLTLLEFLQLFGRAHGLYGPALQQRIHQCLSQVNLWDKRKEWCRHLSRGMMQRLVLAKTLLHKPRVLVLDEPASGMDPRSRNALRDSLRELASQGVAILISSHILSELSDMCTHLGLLSGGTLMASGSVAEVLAETENNRRIHIQLIPPAELQPKDQSQNSPLSSQETALKKKLNQHPDISQTQRLSPNLWQIQLHGDDHAQSQLLQQLSQAQLPILSFQRKLRSLEEIVLSQDPS